MARARWTDAFIADDPADFVARGVALTTDLHALNELRMGMRARCATSPAFNPDVVANGLSRAFRVMWQRWCDGLPPDHLDVAAGPVSADAHTADA